jgi:MarR family transcriptional regulator for hemolysin
MEEPLGRQLAITGRQVRDRFDACMGQHGASLATWVVLRCAEREEGLSQRELASRVNIEGPTLVRHLDRMEQDGLVERCRDDVDRRVVRVSLTATGRRRHAELVDVAATLDAELRTLLDDDEIEILQRVLPRIRECWHPEARDGDAGDGASGNGR